MLDLARKLFVFIFFLGLFYVGKSQTPGTKLFDATYVHTLNITSLYPGFSDTLFNHYVYSYDIFQTQTRKIPYTYSLIEIDGTVLDTIGIRYKGNNSWWSSQKKPIKVDINRIASGQTYDGLKKFNLHNGTFDPTLMRENLCYRILNKLNISAPRTAYAEVFIDNVYQGLYRLVEQIDNTFLDAHFGDHDGNLYKQGAIGSFGYDLSWIDNSPSSYEQHLDLENHEKSNDWSGLIHFLDVLNNTSDLGFKDSIAEVFDVEEYLQILAFDIAIGNIDFYGTSGRNYYLYHDAGGDNKFHWLPWDYNITWVGNGVDVRLNPDDYPILIKRILNVPEYYAYYLERFCFVIAQFNATSLNPVIDADSVLIRPYLTNDPYLDYPIPAFEKNISQTYFNKIGLKEMISIKNPDISTTLDMENIDCDLVLDIENYEINDFEIKLYPNPASQTLHISSDIGIIEISLLNSVGQEVFNRKSNLETFCELDIGAYSKGIYFVKIETRQGILVKKVTYH